ncbi:MAG: sugar phosphate nucleotidyltransferase [Nitrospirota bacterium]|nr:sugar phosphate nucleotidyltransferase [Nitrospirota bacterium]
MRATQTTASGQLWSIILAAGEGTGVNPFVSRWLGRSLPKEYCAFVGARSMFQHALDRTVQMTPPERVIAVVAREHRHEAFSQLDRRTIGALLLQPVHQGTAANLFLALTYVRERDPEATVVVFPSDHFVYPEDRYLTLARQAASITDRLPDRLLLLGASPDRLELEYGWIHPGDRLPDMPDHHVRAVRSLVEKPTAADADSLLQAGGFWNTRAFTAKVSTLWKVGRQCIPHLMPLFERLGQAIGCPNEALELETIYRKIPPTNLPDLLRQVPDRLALLELTGVLWNEWNKPERIAETLRRIDRQPAFPLTCLDHPFTPLTRVPVEKTLVLNRPSTEGVTHEIAQQPNGTNGSTPRERSFSQT